MQVDGGQTATYVYDGFDRRVVSQTAAGSFDYLYDYAGRLVSTWKTGTTTGVEARIF